ncbi:hypothetical protein ACNKHW_23095 [Shigella flexneri]
MQALASRFADLGANSGSQACCDIGPANAGSLTILDMAAAQFLPVNDRNI